METVDFILNHILCTKHYNTLLRCYAVRMT